MQWKSYLVTFLLAGTGLNHSALAGSAAHAGYYRQPALHHNQLVFTSEGDLWIAKTDQAIAHRLTSRRGVEDNAIISPDGQQVAFAANYEGEYEVYVMPVAGGIPERITFEQTDVRPQEWTSDGQVLYATNNSVGPLGTWRLKVVNPKTFETRDIPLSDANQGNLDADEQYLYFTRFGSSINGDHLRSYHGGAQGQIWRYQSGSQQEAQLLTPDGTGSNNYPMYYQGKVYYLSDQSGNPNLWSMNPDGSEKKQLTHYTQWPIRHPSLSEGRIVFQLGADLALYTIGEPHHAADNSTGASRILPIQLVSDQPYRQPRWIKQVLDYETSTALTPDGQRAVITARGKVAVATIDGTRLIEISTPRHSRVKLARMSQDKRWIYAICDASGEEQIWRFAADGSEDIKQVTHDGHTMRWSLSVSPDGKYLLTDDKDGYLWLVDAESGSMKKLLDHGPVNEPFGSYRWSDDSRYIAIGTSPDNKDRAVVILYDVKTDRHQQLTTDKYRSFSPDFSSDGKWLYFLSDRHFHATPSSPWYDRTPDPVFSHRTGIFAIALDPKADFPFQPLNELINDTIVDQQKEEKKPVPAVAKSSENSSAKPDVDAEHPVAPVLAKVSQTDSPAKVVDDHTEVKESESAEDRKDSPIVDWDGLSQRLWQVPVPPGNYSHLRAGNRRLYLLSRTTSDGYELKSVSYSRRHVRLETVSDSIDRYALSQHREDLFVVFEGDSYIVPAESSLPDKLDEYRLNADQWHMLIQPADEWMQMFHSAWLMHRDMFYDPSLRGVDWNAVKTQAEPLLTRVSDRNELADLLGQMTSHLNALHSQVSAGDDRPKNVDTAQAASLGAVLLQTGLGVKIDHIYQTDPEVPAMASPLAKPGVDAQDGDLIVAINRHPVISVADVSELLRNQIDQEVLLTLSRAGEAHQTVVYPVDSWEGHKFAYRDWSEQNRQRVAQQSHNQIGYIYLHAMVRNDFDTFAREFYANIDKQGLIIDVRNNQGGSVDSWILDKLMRRAWMFWSARHGTSYPNMQQAFRGHIAVLANQMTYSDGETFTAGIKALNLGPVIGMRTFGAGVWLDDSNQLTDWGRARVAEYPQYSLDGNWLVEQRGVSPTIQVDNLPYATFTGSDAQLEKAIELLNDKIKTSPVKPLVPVVKAGESVQAKDVISEPLNSESYQTE